MKLFLLILVFIGILGRVTKGHSIPKNGTIANVTLTKNPASTQTLTENADNDQKFDTIINLILGFGIFFVVVIGLVILGCLIGCCVEVCKKDFFKKFYCCCRKNKKKDEPTLEEKTRIAYHEAGHAIVAFFHKDGHEIKEVSIKPSKFLLGHVKYQPLKKYQARTKSKILAEISHQLGGRAVDELRNGPDQICDGSRRDIRNATSTARDMVNNLGMSEKFGVQQLYNDQDEETKKMFNEEVNSIMKDAYERAKAIINEHEEQLNVLAQAILDYETLNGQEVKDILEGKPIQRKKKVQAAIHKEDEEPLAAENNANVNSVA